MNIQNLKISKLQFLEDYQITIHLCNGHVFSYNIASKLDTIRFAELKKKELYYNGSIVNGRIIRWSPSIEISLDEIITQQNLITRSN